MGIGTLRRYHRVSRPAGYTPEPEAAPEPQAEAPAPAPTAEAAEDKAPARPKRKAEKAEE